jgi:hypothetical protein
MKERSNPAALSNARATMKTETLKATINGYSVELELIGNGPGGLVSTQCTITRGRFSASLEAARAGQLTDARGNETPISERDIDAIDKWAMEKGYGTEGEPKTF